MDGNQVNGSRKTESLHADIVFCREREDVPESCCWLCAAHPSSHHHVSTCSCGPCPAHQACWPTYLPSVRRVDSWLRLFPPIHFPIPVQNPCGKTVGGSPPKRTSEPQREQGLSFALFFPSVPFKPTAHTPQGRPHLHTCPLAHTFSSVFLPSQVPNISEPTRSNYRITKPASSLRLHQAASQVPLYLELP